MHCVKRPYHSVDQARRANRYNNHCLRVYFCAGCRAYHVTKRDQ